MVIVNGVPKSGSHAVMALLARMGVRKLPGTLLTDAKGVYLEGSPLRFDHLHRYPDSCFTLGHVSAFYDLSKFLVITVFRDPRNVLVSHCRHRKHRDGVDVTLAQAIEDFWGERFIPLYRSYLGWIGRSIVMRFEDVAHSVGDGKDIYRNEPADWNTHTGSHSRWQDVWDQEADDLWLQSGGKDLEWELSKAGLMPARGN